MFLFGALGSDHRSPFTFDRADLLCLWDSNVVSGEVSSGFLVFFLGQLRYIVSKILKW